MFDSLSNRLQDVFKTLRGETRLTPAVVEVALREIRLALLEADVNFKVVKAFVDRVRDRAMDTEVQKGLNPSQQVIKIVRDELLALFGDAKGGLQETTSRPRVILMLGLQGSGKTTTTGKLAKWLAKQGRHPLLVSVDVKRPAAIAQLNVVAGKAGVQVFDPAGDLDPVSRAKGAMAQAATKGFDVVIVDEAQELTDLGRQLARLPMDPRVGRMILAGRDHQCLREILIIAAALSVQDPRDRPIDVQAAADAAHKKFADEKSDSLCESSDLRLVVGSECDCEPCKVASAPVVSTPSTPLLAALTS